MPRHPAQATRGPDPERFETIVASLERYVLPALVLMMGIAAAIWLWRGSGVVAPWIFSDEFIYWELGRNLADNGKLTVREDVGNYYSIVVPVLALPGHLLGDEVFASQWIKVANPIVMALSAVPAYGLARMALRPLYALLFAGTVLALPAFAYTGSIMTEPVFLPVFLLAVWALARALESPTLLRQGIAIGAVLLAVGVRLQGISLFAAMALAALVLVVRGTSPADGLGGMTDRARALAPMLVFSIVVPAVLLARQRLGGSSDRELLGGYETANIGRADNSALYEWGLRHVGLTLLAIAVVPAIFAVATWIPVLLRKFDHRPDSAALLAGVASIPPMMVLVVVFAANNAGRIQERNLFYVEPLIVLAAMIGLANDRYSRWLIAPAAALAGWLVMRLPLEELLAQPPIANTMSLFAFGDAASDFDSTPSGLVAAVAVTGIVLAVAFTFTPRWVPLVLMPTIVAAFMVALSFQVSPAVNDFSARAAATTVPEPRDWIGRSEIAGTPVGLIWPSDRSIHLAWQAEIFNDEIETVIAVGHRPLPGLGNQGSVNAESGFIEPIAPGTRLPEEKYIAAPADFELRGRQIASAPLLNGEMVLYEAERPLRVARTHTGYTADGWTAQEAVTRQFSCSNGAFVITLGYGHGGPQRVTLTASGGSKRAVVLSPGAQREVRMPATPDGSGNCELRLSVPDARSDDELSGNGNPRLLGVRARPPAFAPADR